MNKHKQIVRDQSWIDREYNKEKWLSAFDQMTSLVDQGERNLVRVLSRAELQRQRAWAPDASILSPHPMALCGEMSNVPFGAVFEGLQALICKTIIEACTTETGAIVELGSGIGQNLFWLWLYGGPREIPYYSMEITENGRAATEKLASLEPDLRVTPLRFDYHSPDLSQVQVEGRHVIVFTSQSIEQIPQLDQSVFHQICDLAEEVTCIHFEPVGWQIGDNSAYPTKLNLSGEYAETHDYNRNLWPVLMQLEAEGRISIDDVARDFYSLVPDNALTFIRWHKL